MQGPNGQLLTILPSVRHLNHGLSKRDATLPAHEEMANEHKFLKNPKTAAVSLLSTVHVVFVSDVYCFALLPSRL